MPAVVALLVAALALGAGLSSCRDRSPSTAPSAASPQTSPTPAGGDPSPDGGTLRYAIAEPSAIVPPEAVGSAALAVVDALFDSLTAWGPDWGTGPQTPELQVRPAAALRWSSDDARTWTFHLRPGATFHDGVTAVTADDFAYAWDLAVGLDQVGYHLRDVEGYERVRSGEAAGLEGVTAVDEHTLRVRLAAPNAEFPAVVGHPALGPLPRALWEADPAGFRERPVGNGPFAMSEPWARAQFVRVAPYDGWRNRVTKPSVTEVVFQVMDPDTAYLAFQQGRLDFTELPPGALSDAEELFGVSPDGYRGPGVLRGEVPVLYYLGFRTDHPPFDDVVVRRAVSQAVDRTAIAGEVLGGNVDVARSIVPPVLRAGRAGLCRACRLDPAAARQVFADRGVTSLVLWFNTGGGHERVARRLQRDLRAVGVDLELRSEEFPAYLAALEAGQAGLFRFGWAVDYPTLDNALYPILHSRSRAVDGGYNHGAYAAPDVDALLDEARTSLDPDQRRARYTEAADLALIRDQAIAPLFTYRHAAVASDRVDGLVLNPMGLVDLVGVSIVEPEQD